MRPVGESCVEIACAVPHCVPGLMNAADSDSDPASVRAGSKVLRTVLAFKMGFSALPAEASMSASVSTKVDFQLTVNLQNVTQ